MMAPDGCEWLEIEGGGLILCVDRQLYSDEAVFRACYVFTDRCYLFLEQRGATHLFVRFRRRTDGVDLTAILGDFQNELINQRLRVSLARETSDIRTLIVTRAFADATFEGR